MNFDKMLQFKIQMAKNVEILLYIDKLYTALEAVITTFNYRIDIGVFMPRIYTALSFTPVVYYVPVLLRNLAVLTAVSWSSGGALVNYVPLLEG